MDSRIDVTGCQSRGYGDWREVTDPGVPTPTGYYFICQATETNPLWDIAGIQMSTTYYWVVDNGAVVAVITKKTTPRRLHSARHSTSGWKKPTQNSTWTPS